MHAVFAINTSKRIRRRTLFSSLRDSCHWRGAVEFTTTYVQQTFLFVCIGCDGNGGLSHGATLCVNPGGTAGCFAHINDAVSSASVSSTIKIAPGTYKEAVIVTRPLALTGENGAIIDATGLSVGIFVDGLNNPGLSDVAISGLTVENAKFRRYSSRERVGRHRFFETNF